MGEAGAELPPELRHQMDDWADQVREQQLGFLAAADELEGQAEGLRDKLTDAGAGGRESLEHELRLVTELATSARTMSRVPFLIPEEGIAVREDPDAPDGLAYADPRDVDPLFGTPPDELS